eukprot:5589323-Amphidinium_carterae.1
MKDLSTIRTELSHAARELDVQVARSCQEECIVKHWENSLRSLRSMLCSTCCALWWKEMAYSE